MDQLNSPEVPLRVAFYLRVSSEDQVEKYGLSMQKEALLAMIKSRGKLKDGVTDAMILAGENYIYVEEGVSGTTKMNERPAFAQLEEDITKNKDNRPFDVVMVYKLDRFARKLRILLDIVGFFEDYGIKFISANESIDTSTPFGKAMIGILGVIAELELETIKARMEGGKAEAKKLGKFMGVPPLGYKKDSDLRLVVETRETETVKLIFDLFTEQKKTTHEIAAHLTKQEFLSPEAAAIHHKKKDGEMKKKNDDCFWRAEKVGKILEDEVYIGKLYFNKNEKNKKLPKDKWTLSPHRHEAIISLLTFEKAHILMDRNRQFQSKSTDHSYIYLLSGLIRCDACKDGPSMKNWIGTKKELTKGTGNYTYSYYCGGKNTAKSSRICKTIPFPAEEIELYIFNFVNKLLSNPVTVYNYQQKLRSTSLKNTLLEKERKHLQGIIDGIPGRKKKYLEQHASGYISKDELDDNMEKLRKSELEMKKMIEDIERRMQENAMSNNYIKVFGLFKDKYATVFGKAIKDRGEVSKILHMMVDDIIVYSRPVTEKDVIAGRKKLDQLIPYKIDIKFRLPQELLEELVFAKGGTVTVRGEEVRSESRMGVEPI